MKMWEMNYWGDFTPVLEVTPTLRRARPRKNIEIPKETWKLYGLGGGDVRIRKKKKILL